MTAIHEAASDCNPATDPDPNWAPLISNPPYPDHPSGLTCFAGALAQTLTDVFRTARIPFTVRSAASGTERSYAGFTDALREAIEARIWSGIHFRSADEQGARVGRRVARNNTRQYLRPLPRHRR